MLQIQLVKIPAPPFQNKPDPDPLGYTVLVVPPAAPEYCQLIVMFSVSDPYSLNSDPVPDSDPDPSYFLPLSEIFFKLLICIRFSHQKKSIKKQNVVKVTKK